MRLNKMTVLLSISAILICSIPTEIKAESNNSLKNDVVYTTMLMEELLQTQYDNMYAELEREIEKQGLNYTLTTESFTDAGNPYTEVEYDELIAAVCTAVGNCGTKNITDLEFLTMNVDVKEMTQGVPTKIYTYEESEDGHYIKSGVRYIVETEERDRYVKAKDFKDNTNEHYEKNGKETVSPQIETIKYGEVTLSVPGAKEILAQVGKDITDESVASEYNNILEKIKASGLATELLNDCTFIDLQSGATMLSEEAKDVLNQTMQDIEGNRKVLIETAVTLIGRVPYQWGGKSEKAGYDTSWYTSLEDGRQKGLDCSGFVQWAYRTAGYSSDTWSKIGSTSAIIENATAITSSELLPGDLGILNMGESTNHTGIYIGNGYWIHCNSSDGTVNITQAKFNYYYRVDTVDTEKLETSQEETYQAIEYTQEELDEISEVVWNVAAGEGVNGWIAVTEVIKNRLISDKYPSSIEGILEQEGQFEARYAVDDVKTKENEKGIVKMVLDGQIALLNNIDCVEYMDAENTADWNADDKRIGNLIFLESEAAHS